MAERRTVKDTAPLPAGARTVLWSIPAVYFLFVAGEFTAMTHLALRLTERGHSALAVGVVASALWVGILLASLRSHAAVQRHGHARVFVGATTLAFAAIATIALHEHYLGWLGAAFVLGWGGGFVWVAGESWLAEVAPPQRRGLFVGLFETSVGLGLMAGPALVPLALALDWAPPWVGTALVGAALLASLALLRAPLPEVGPQHGPAPGQGPGSPAARPAWRDIAMPLAAVATVSGLMESGISALLPSISMRLGFGLAEAAALGAVIGAGSALLQPPFGWLADRIGLPRAMALAWVLVLAALAVLLATARAPQGLLWGVGFVLGGVGGAVYTLVVVELGHRLAGSDLVRAMALLVTAYTLGTAGGPAAGGWLFDTLGLTGLAAVLLAIGLAGAGLAWRALRPAISPPASAASRR